MPDLMRRAPRKYLDKHRTRLNPAWAEWNYEREALQIGFYGPGTFGAYFPEEVEKEIPAQGCWIRVIDVPHTELSHRFDVPVLSMWRARHSIMSHSEELCGRKPQLAVINTPGGELSLWPHEYVIVPEIREYVGCEPDVTMHVLGDAKAYTEKQESMLFYMQSRGITRRDASLMVFDEPEISCYFTMSDEYVEMFAGVGIPLWRHMALHPR